MKKYENVIVKILYFSQDIVTSSNVEDDPFDEDIFFQS